MSYPHRLYIAVSSCGRRGAPEVGSRGNHRDPEFPQTVPCGPQGKPEQHAKKRLSRFNWMGEANADNPAYISPVETYRHQKKKERPRKVAAIAAVLILVLLGVGAFTFALTQNATGSLYEAHTASSAPFFFPGATGSQEPQAVTSTAQQDWEKGSVPYLYQMDPQWANATYASSKLGISGQAPLSLAMASIALTGSTDVRPEAIAAIIDEAGFATQGVTDPACITRCSDALGLKTADVSLNELGIRKALVSGKPILCVMGPGDFTKTRTFIVLTDIDMDSKLTVRDPASANRSSTTWNFSTIIDQAEEMTAVSVLPAMA